jgi:hypothetical protein
MKSEIADRECDRPESVRAHVALAERMAEGRYRCGFRPSHPLANEEGTCATRATRLVTIEGTITPLCAAHADAVALDRHIEHLRQQRDAMRNRR